MKTKLLLFATWLLLASPLHAQLVADGATNTLANVTNTITGNVTVGTNGSFTLLVISNNVLLTNSATGLIGNNSTAKSNEVRLVSPTSRWLMGGGMFVGNSGSFNRLVVSNGAKVFNDIGLLSGQSSASNNFVLVTGAGSTWSNRSVLNVGNSGAGNNRLIIEDGGQVFNASSLLGGSVVGSNDVAVVTGNGSLWSNRGDLFVGYNGSYSTLLVSNGSIVISSNGTVGNFSDSRFNLATVTGSGSLWSNGAGMFVGQSSSGNQLVVSNGGTLTSSNALIGFSTLASFNTALVTGAGTVWSNRDELSVGDDGFNNQLIVSDGAKVGSYSTTVGNAGINNKLTVSEGAKLVSGYVYIGNEAASARSNLVLVTGTGSLLTNSVLMFVGVNGNANQLVVSNGAEVLSVDCNIGNFGSNNLALVTDPGSRWAADDLSVGVQGIENRLMVTNGGQLQSERTRIGYFGPSIGNQVLVSGTGSSWTNDVFFYVGTGGDRNQLVVSNGGLVKSSTSEIGHDPGSSDNEVVVTGTNSLWRNDFLDVGSSGSSNRLVVSNGATVSIGVTNFITGAPVRLIVGSGLSSSNNRVVVDGGTLRINDASLKGYLDVRRGTNVLKAGLIDVDWLFLTNSQGFFEFNGGTLITHSATISNGLAFVVGPSGFAPATWDVRAGITNHLLAGRLIVGSNSSFNQVFITNGAVLNGSDYTFLAFTSGSNNAVTISGPGSTLNSSFGFFVGADGNANRMLISNGGRAIASLGNSGSFIGRSTGTRSNEVVVTGPGSRWSINDVLYVGSGGNANLLVVSNGATTDSLVGYVGSANGGSNNLAIITGANSSWSNRSELYIGASGSPNRLVLSEGATLINSNAYLALNLSSRSNTVEVTGLGTLWNNRGDLFVGYDGTHNQLLVSNNAIVSVLGNLFLGLNPTTSTGNRLVVDGGALLVTNTGGTGLLEVKRGTNVLNAGLITADVLRMTNGQSRMEFNGGTLSIKSSRVSIGNPLLVGDGANPATLFLAGNGTHDFSGTLGLILSNNATLTGNGTVLAQLQVRSGAVLAPGASVGKISLNPPPFLSGTTLMELSKNGSTLTNDQIEVTGTVTYGGTLSVTHLGPTPLAGGDKFKLFNAAAYTGSFTSLSLPPLPPGLFWVNNLLVDGSIEVFAPPPVGAGFALSFDGTNDSVFVSHDSRLNAYPLIATIWIKTTQATGEVGIINKYLAGSLNGWHVGLLNGEVRAWYLRDNANRVGNEGGGLNGGPVNNGAWHHVAFTVDNIGGRIYVDGFLRDEMDWTGAPGACTTTQPLNFGRYPGGAGEFFKGELEEAAIGGLATTQGEIKNNLDRGLIGSELGLVSYHRFNEGTGFVAGNAARASGTLTDGFLQNGVIWVPGLTFRPAVMTKIATTVAANSATLHGVANPGLVNTTAWFEWGTTTNYGNSTTVQFLGSGGSNTNFSQSITGLTQNVTYHFRAAASNVIGASFGADKNFVASGTNMLTPRANHTATLLPNGKVLVAGGRDQDQIAASSAELFDPATGSWAFTSPMSTVRYNHTATLLPNGKVLVAGGQGQDFTPPHSSAELYDPVTGAWTLTGSMQTNRYSHTATLLSNGKVLVAGGNRGNNTDAIAELYDPATGTWTETGALAGLRYYHTTTLLPNGKVLVSGGINATNAIVSSAELYDPTAGTWAFTGSMTTNRYGHTATLLRNGKVLVVGGRGLANFLNSAELYDPLAGTWATTGAMLNYRFFHTATLLPDGKVFASGNGIGVPSVYNPLTETWTDVPGPDPFIGPTATLLLNGNVLVAGGFSSGGPTAEAELYVTPKNESWTATAPMASARGGHTATLLSNALVLVASFGNSEIYNPSSGLWTNTGALVTGRSNHTATLLPNGKVLAVGGQSDFFAATIASAELYTPSLGTWTNTGSLASNRVSHSATLLGNGKVLVAGGISGAIFAPPYQDAELYDPATGSWTNTSAMTTNRSEHSATLLPNGKVLVTGGIVSGGLFPPVTPTAELYDPASGTWTAVAPMTTNRRRHISVLLPNGKVLVAGGLASTDIILTVNSSAELFDPATGNWQPTGSMTSSRRDARATLLPNGKVLVTGGRGTGSLPSAELYDPGTGTWTATLPMGAARSLHTSTMLPNGKLLVAGGYSNGNSATNRAELYDIGLLTTPSWKPQILTATSPLNLGGSLALTGTQFRGLSGGPGGNGGQDSPTDYPIVQLRRLDNEQAGFISSTDWSSNSFASVPVSGFPPGWAMATVYVSSIPSDSKLLYITAATPTAFQLTGMTMGLNGHFQFSFTNTPGASFTVLATTNIASPLSNWNAVTGLTETSPGQYQFTDTNAPAFPIRFYRALFP